jgi:hypothetical protein
MRSENRDSHSSHVKRTRGRAQQESSGSDPRSINFTSSSNTDCRINKIEPMKLETAAEVVEVGAAIRYALEDETNSSWANRTEPTEPGKVVEMAEAMAATRYTMEGEAEHNMGARTAGSEFVEEANLDEIEEECHSDAQGRERRCVQLEINYTSSSNECRINKTEPTNPESVAEVVMAGAATRRRATEQPTESARVLAGGMPASGEAMEEAELQGGLEAIGTGIREKLITGTGHAPEEETEERGSMATSSVCTEIVSSDEGNGEGLSNPKCGDEPRVKQRTRRREARKPKSLRNPTKP